MTLTTAELFHSLPQTKSFLDWSVQRHIVYWFIKILKSVFFSLISPNIILTMRYGMESTHSNTSPYNVINSDSRDRYLFNLKYTIITNNSENKSKDFKTRVIGKISSFGCVLSCLK